MTEKKKYVVAMDSFKGCLTAAEACDAVAEALHGCDGGAEVVRMPVSDGGEGMLETAMAALGGDIISTYVHDPLMRRIEAEYGVTPDGTAIIETARACGLSLIKEDERNPVRATSYGMGELLAAAVKR